MANTATATNGKGTVLVIGGGIAGITAAIEAAEAGCQVILVEKSPYLGGRVAAFTQYFPKLCPPSCGLEINFRRLQNNPRIRVLTLAELVQLNGSRGNYEAVVRIAPRYVTKACTLCNACANVCPAEIKDDFNFGLKQQKAVHIRRPAPFPAAYVIERSACPPDCRACVEQCSYKAIDLGQAPEQKTFKVSAVVVATGWSPYDATKLDNLGFGRYPNVVTNVILERLAAENGPTDGKVVRPSDGKEPASVAFVQCAGSRDEKHLPYCSAVCCSASLKQATYIRSRYPESKVTIFYIDLRTPGKLEEFASTVRADKNIELMKGKVGKIEEDAESKDLLVTVEDVVGGKRITRPYSMVVLATGIVPETRGIGQWLNKDEFGFLAANDGTGVYSAGCVKRPAEVSGTVRDATGASLKALQAAAGATHHG